ncbi:hypothetical protein [Gordonia sp. NB41Y]|nr:hypothetical protein [Gordonia sp. NB41Y]WLP89959.1 hypothetical protein Q9K23_20865 [Gordonia sp. NB41Y]
MQPAAVDDVRREFDESSVIRHASVGVPVEKVEQLTDRSGVEK